MHASARWCTGALEPRTGALESTVRAAELPGHNHRVAVVGGVRSDECRALMQEFFKQRRGVKADAVAASGSGPQASGDRKEAMGDGR